jgi:putative aldouronate transport system permease protein
MLALQPPHSGGARLRALAGVFARQKYIFMLLIPGLIWFLLYKYWPLWYISMAFTNAGHSRRAEIHRHAELHAPFFVAHFGPRLLEHVILSFYNLLFGFPMPILLALSMNELRRVYKAGGAVHVYIPHFFSWVVLGGLFHDDAIPAERHRQRADQGGGHESIYFMASKDWFRSVLVTSSIWKDVGY